MLVCYLVELAEFRLGAASSTSSVQECDEGYGSDTLEHRGIQ